MSSNFLPTRFEIQSVLGSGGLGRVYRALDRSTDREIAVKIVGPSESIWLRREFDTLRQIRHENLIQVFDWSSLPSGESYYTMELVDGTDLGRLIDAPIPAEEVRRILAGALRALGHLHCHREIHGDVKPGNILLGRGGVVKVSDVGMGDSRGVEQATGGTAGYAAPEIWSGESASIRSDLYSLGVVAYECLTGKHPFGAQTVREVVLGQIEGWVPSPGVHGVNVPPDLERAIMRALERDPALRQATADEFLEGIGEGGNAGEILTGRFVDRLDEVEHLERFAHESIPNTPTLLYIVGPSGVGKSMLLCELSDRDAARRLVIHELRDPERELAELAGVQYRKEYSTTEVGLRDRVSAVADKLVARYQDRIVLLAEDPASANDYLRDSARYVWAEAAERRAASNVRFIRVVHTKPTSLEPFETCLSLTPFDLTRAAQLIDGILGSVEVDQQFLERLVSETGGMPGSLAAGTLELVDRKLLTRRYGRWQIADLSDADWASLRAGISRWERSWSRLDEPEKDILTGVGLVRGGLAPTDLKAVFSRVEVEAAVGRLQAYGWITQHGGRLRLASREAARAVMASQHATRQGRIGETVLHELGVRLPRPDRAALLIAVTVSEETVREALWLGTHLQSHRRFTEATRTFIKARDIARALGDTDGAGNASLNAAEGLYRSGANAEAVNVLNEEHEWGGSVHSDGINASRSRLLGLAYKALGDLEHARIHFLASSAKGKHSGNIRLWLQAEAELAEIEWRHGGEAGRSAAARRIKELASQRSEGNRDEWAALRYQLGASLVVAGQREQAIGILEDALSLAESNYWRMRIGNALAAAHYYLGKFRLALAAADEAWKHAVEGEVNSFKPRILATMSAIRIGLGMFREAAEQDQMAAFWGRRMGNAYEHEAGLLAAAVDSIHLAEFEQAIGFASAAREVAQRIPSPRDVAKSYEMEGLALLHLGDYVAAGDLFASARAILEGRGFDDLAPRLCWHEARIEMECGRFASAEAKLVEALKVLEHTRDWEDLPGVKVELQLLFARAGSQELSVEEVRAVLRDAQEKETGLVQLRATLALAEIANSVETHSNDVLESLLDGLRLAERAGAKEFVWRLSYWIGRHMGVAGDLRGANTRLTNAVRAIREVAAGLTPPHRACYLGTSHARLLLSEAASTTDSPRARQDWPHDRPH